MTKKIAVLFLAAGLAMAAGCKSELDNKTAAKVSESTGEENAAEEKAEEAKADEKSEEAEARELAVATDQSSIGWVGAKVTGDHKGGFKKFDGKLVEKGGEVEKVEFTVDTTSVFSDAEKLTGHLKSEDFFHVEKHPEAKFVSKKIVEKESKTEDGKTTFTHEVTGDFTIRGVTKELTFPANIKVADDKVQASTEFTFNRFDFDIVYKGKPDDLIRKEVLLKVDLVAPTDAAAGEAKKAEAETEAEGAGK